MQRRGKAAFPSAFDLVCAYIRSAAGVVRFRSPLQPVSALPLLHIWYENSCEFYPKPHRRAAAAARSTPNRKPRSAWYALLCTARAASAQQRQAMAGQGRSPCGLGGSKGGHSSAKNGPFCWPSEGVSPFDLPCRPRHSPRGSAQSGFSFAKRPSLAGRQRASALLICRAALGTLL